MVTWIWEWIYIKVGQIILFYSPIYINPRHAEYNKMSWPLLISANQINWSTLMKQIHVPNDKECRSRSVGFFRSQLILIYTVCKGRHIVVLQKPTDLDLKCLQRQGILGFFRGHWPFFSTLSQLLAHLLCPDNFCRQFGLRSGPTFCGAWSGSKLFDTLMVFLNVFFFFFWKSQF